MKSSIEAPLGFILMLLIVIMIPTLIYGFFFLIKCPPNSCLRYPSQPAASEMPRTTAEKPASKLSELAVSIVTGSTSKKAAGDCPVCLSAFEEGEVIWQLDLCKHLFHAPCIDRWLHTHSNCPVCRAYISASKLKPPPRVNPPATAAAAAAPAREDDLWQGLPNSAGLV